MNQSEEILKLAKENRGFFTSKMVDQAGLSRGSLKYLLDKGELEKTARGVYITVEDTFEDEWWALQQRYTKGVFSLNTALYIEELSDRFPYEPNLCFPRGYNTSGAKSEGILAHTVDKDIHSLGIIEAKSICQNTLRIYCPERTLAEILRPQNVEDIAIIVDAFNWYMSRRNKNIRLLCHFGDIFKVSRRLGHYLEVLL